MFNPPTNDRGQFQLKIRQAQHLLQGLYQLRIEALSQRLQNMNTVNWQQFHDTLYNEAQSQEMKPGSLEETRFILSWLESTLAD